MDNFRNSNELSFGNLTKTQSTNDLPDILDFRNCYISTQNFYKQYASNNELFLNYINIWSLHKNFEKLEELLLPDLIVISETKLNSRLNYNLKSYSFVQNNSNTNAGGAGLFMKGTFNYKAVNDYDLKIRGCEEIWIKQQ